jgi:hypothetical protein
MDFARAAMKLIHEKMITRSDMKIDRREFIKLAGAALLAPAVGKLLPEGLESDYILMFVVTDVIGDTAVCNVIRSINSSVGEFRISPIGDHVSPGNVYVIKNGKQHPMTLGL